MVQQNIVFVENKAGSLKRVTEILKEAKINIYGFACFDYPEFASFRMICDQPDRANEILSENGYMSRLTNAIMVHLKDETGSLDEVLDVFAESNVSLNYIYTSYHRKTMKPVVILHSEELTVTEGLLKYRGFEVMEDVTDIEKDGE